jgi:flagellar basal body-associated protein FliL
VIHTYYRAAFGAVCLLPLALASCGGSSHGASSSHDEPKGHGASASHGESKGHGASSGHGSHAKAAVADSGHGSAGAHDADPQRRHDPTEMIEVDLGEFTVTQRQPDSNILLLVRFKIFGVIEREKKDDFAKLLEDRRQRMRDSVITIVQRADMEQLSDPTLGWLKSEIIPSVNKLLRTRILKDVVFSEFTMLQN